MLNVAQDIIDHFHTNNDESNHSLAFVFINDIQDDAVPVFIYRNEQANSPVERALPVAVGWMSLHELYVLVRTVNDILGIRIAHRQRQSSKRQPLVLTPEQISHLTELAQEIESLQEDTLHGEPLNVEEPGIFRLH